MSDSTSTQAERRSGFAFILLTLIGCALILFAVARFQIWIWSQPDRRELGPRLATLQLSEVRLAAGEGSPFTVAGAWEVKSDDPRFGGISGLAITGDLFVAVTDSGAVAKFGRPGRGNGRVLIREVPQGVRSGRYKRNRDSEAIAADPGTGGWWVAFEQFSALWLYDRHVERAIRRITLYSLDSRENAGIESLVAEGEVLLAIPESGDRLIRIEKGAESIAPIAGRRARISDAAALAPGRLLVLEREPTALGFRNGLAELRKTDAGYVLGRTFALPGSRIDNFEALAVERTGDGLRLWLMTDDSFLAPFRTLLVALDVKPDWPAA